MEVVAWVNRRFCDDKYDEPASAAASEEDAAPEVEDLSDAHLTSSSRVRDAWSAA
jgi:hypothetical protein